MTKQEIKNQFIKQLSIYDLTENELQARADFFVNVDLKFIKISLINEIMFLLEGEEDNALWFKVWINDIQLCIFTNVMKPFRD